MAALPKERDRVETYPEKPENIIVIFTQNSRVESQRQSKSKQPECNGTGASVKVFLSTNQFI
jgi:hypothetical protein